MTSFQLVNFLFNGIKQRWQDKVAFWKEYGIIDSDCIIISMEMHDTHCVYFW